MVRVSPNQIIIIIIIIIIISLGPCYSTDFGMHRKSVLKQNSVIMRVLYTGSISNGSQALTVL